MKRIIYKDVGSGRIEKFTVTYDEYGVVDTIERTEWIKSTSRDARVILKHADQLRDGFAPPGFKF